MPPPNDGFPGPPPGGPQMPNAHVQQFMNMVMQAVQTTMHGMLVEHLQQINQTISPQGRPVIVNRRVNGKIGQQQTTTPQLLAELCDRLKESNKLIRQQMKMVHGDDDEDDG